MSRAHWGVTIPIAKPLLFFLGEQAIAPPPLPVNRAECHRLVYLLKLSIYTVYPMSSATPPSSCRSGLLLTATLTRCSARAPLAAGRLAWVSHGPGPPCRASRCGCRPGSGVLVGRCAKPARQGHGLQCSWPMRHARTVPLGRCCRFGPLALFCFFIF
jgi:hypothetical protein